MNRKIEVIQGYLKDGIFLGFEETLEEFIKDKEILSIHYSTTVNEGYETDPFKQVLHSALIVYKEIRIDIEERFKDLGYIKVEGKEGGRTVYKRGLEYIFCEIEDIHYDSNNPEDIEKPEGYFAGHISDAESKLCFKWIESNQRGGRCGKYLAPSDK